MSGIPNPSQWSPDIKTLGSLIITVGTIAYGMWWIGERIWDASQLQAALIRDVKEATTAVSTMTTDIVSIKTVETTQTNQLTTIQQDLGSVKNTTAGHDQAIQKLGDKLDELRGTVRGIELTTNVTRNAVAPDTKK
jgi:septal ring factor EnvC (AmiA/AmiB activator)